MSKHNDTIPQAIPAGEFQWGDFLEALEVDDEFRRLVLRHVHPVPEWYPAERRAHLPPGQRATAWDLEFIAWSAGWEKYDRWCHRIVPAELAGELLAVLWPAFMFAYASMLAEQKQDAEKREARAEELDAEIAVADQLLMRQYRRLTAKMGGVL